MIWYLLPPVLLALSFLYQLTLNIVQYRSAGNPTPANVADVFDAETYTRWKRYCGEKSRLGILSTVVSFLVNIAGASAGQQRQAHGTKAKRRNLFTLKVAVYH